MFSCRITFGTSVTAHISGFILGGLKLIFFFFFPLSFFFSSASERPCLCMSFDPWPHMMK